MAPTSVFYACVLVSLAAALLGFLALGDMVQLLVSFPRSFTYAVFKIRFVVMIVGLGAFAGALGLWIADRPGSALVFAGFTVLFAVLFFAGFLAPIYVMFPARQHSARYVPVTEVCGALPDDEKVLVVEVANDARAFPNVWMLRPHVAGDRIGGEPVIMTYCGLSHLGMAFRGQLGGRQLDLKVMTQLENNLVLFDAATQEPIEQIYGRAVRRGALESLPSTVMPLSSFRALHPAGKVFWNPPAGFFDRKVRGMMHDLLYAEGKHFDPKNPRPVFPTIEHADPRIPPKELIYGIALDGRAVAWTRAYLERHGNAVTESFGSRVITVKHFPEYRFVDIFEGDVPDVDPQGLCAGVRQRRVPHANEVLWLVWANFYRQTEARF
jgi:hypothetical protein